MSDRHPDLERLVGPDRRRVTPPGGLAGLVLAIAVVLVIAMAALWPRSEPVIDMTTFGFADESVTAEVVASEEGSCSFARDSDCRQVVFAVDDEGAVVEASQEFVVEPGQPDLEVGAPVLLSVVEDENGVKSYVYADRDRRGLLAGLAAIFAVAVIILGRLRGLAAVLGLGLSVAILFTFILPAIVAGRDAVLVAVVGGGVIALVSLYLAHGVTPLTHVAAIGAFSALVLTTLLSWATIELARFSGLASEESFYLVGVPDLDLGGLLLAGVVLGALGALDDVTVTQASAVWEVRSANPSLRPAALAAAGLRVGRDHIVSTVNTLLLAYAGASLPLLILFNLSEQSLGTVASSEVVAVEIVRTLVGSIGLVAAVPATTWLAARVAAGLGGPAESEASPAPQP